ncbi:MAG: DnaJ domain-containing protein [Planctomycetes bacterium]|nr:DnaJ domain-containing protein [Planctomycetota bacterium]
MPADLYSTLGVSRSASAEEIKRAYRSRARELHPDVNKAPDAQKRFAQVQEAHEILSDPKRRELYDHYGYEVAKAGTQPQSQSHSHSSSGWGSANPYGASVDPDEFSDIFSTFFSGRASRAASGGKRAKSSRSRSRSAEPQPDLEPLNVEHTVTFLTAAKGGLEPLRIEIPPSKPRNIELRIPAGTLEGDKLRVRAAGDLGQDVVVTIHVGHHPIFRRVQYPGSACRPGSKDLYADLPLTLSEATLGTTIPVPTLESAVLLKVPPGIASGKLLRLQGRGIKPHSTDKSGEPGDLYFVTVIVPPAPSVLTDTDRKTLQDMGLRQTSPRVGNAWPTSSD